MLRDTHSPQDADTVGIDNLFRNLLQHILSYAGELLSVFQREGFEARLVLLELVYALFNEVLRVPALVDDVLCDGGCPDHVTAGIRPHEDVGSLSHLMLAQIRNDQTLSSVLVRTLHAGGQHWMTFRGVRSNHDNQSCHFNIGNRT